MAVNYAKGVITAEDQFSSTFARLKAEVTGANEGFGKMKAAVIGIATGAVIGGFIAMTKHVLELADATGKGAQKAGMATDEFSKMAYAASLSDVSVQSLTKGIKGLSDMMVKAGDVTSHQAAMMRALGVDIGGSVNDALLKVADTFKILPDGATKTALAVALFGKAGQDMIPMLNAGSAGLKKMQEEAIAFGLVIGEDTAKAAEHLNDNLKTLGMTSQALGIFLVNEFAPPFAQITDEMKKAYIEGGKLNSLWAGWVGLQDLMFSDRFLTKLQVTNKEIRDLEKEVANIMAAQKQAPGLLEFIFGNQDAELWTKLNRTTVALSDLRLKRQELLGVDTEAQRVAKLWKDYYAAEGKALEETTRALLGKGEAQAALAKAAADELLKLQGKGAELEQQLLMGRQLTETEKLLADISAGKYAKYSKEAQLALMVEATYNDELSQQLVLRAADLALLKDEIDAEKKLTDAMTEQRNAADKIIGSMVDKNRNLQFEITLIGKSADEIERLRAAEETRKNVLKATDDTQRTLMEQQGEITQGLIAQSQALKNNTSLWTSMADAAGNFFGDLIVNGKSAFDRLRQSLKSFAAEIISFFAKRYLLQMVAGASGTFGATAANAASSALGGMGNSLMGTGISAASSYLFGSAATTLGASGATIANGSMMMLGGAAGEGAVVGATAGAAGSGGFMAAAGDALAAIGPVGWIALAALAAYKIFAQKQGGPKDSGAGSYSIGADGMVTANPLTDANRFYRADSHGMDAMVSPIVEATAKSFAAYAKIFGITDIATFTQSTDTDPRGTAPNRAATQAYLNGGLVFQANNQDLGRDAAALTPELQLQASRALLAAFQASNLQADLATLLGSVVAASAPQAAIDSLFAQATDLSGVLKALGETKVPDLTLTSLRLLQQAGESLGQTFTRVAEAFLTAQANLNSAIASRNPVFARNLVLNTRNAIADQFLTGIGAEHSAQADFVNWLNRMATDPESFGGLGTASMSLLAQFLGLQTQLEQLDAQLAGSGALPTLITGLGDAGNAALQYAQSLLSAKASLADYLRGSLLGNLSPLSLTQKYDESQSQLQRLIGLATGGDIGAMGQIGGARDAFLGLSQQRFGFSPTYNSDFFRTFDQTNALTNNAATRPMTAADAQAQTAQIIEALTLNTAQTNAQTSFVAQLLDLIKNGISVNDPAVLELLQQIKNSSVSGGATAMPAGQM